MRFSAAKCHLLKITRQQKHLPTKYGISGIQLQKVDHHPYLGVELTADMTWKTHRILKPAPLTATKKLNLEPSLHSLDHILNILRLSGALIWSKIFWPSKKFGGRVPALLPTTTLTEKVSLRCLTCFSGPSLQKGRGAWRLTHLYKVEQLSQVEILEYVTASSGCTRTYDLAFILVQINYEHYKNSYLPRTIREWNALPLDLVHILSVDEFQSRLQT